MIHRFGNVSLVDVVHIDAPVRVSSAQLEDELAPTLARLGMPRGMLEQLTGIRERRFQAPGATIAQAATAAAQRLLGRVGLPTDEVGVLISTSVCRDYIEPSTACIVHGALGLSSSCLNFDIGNACLGFMNGLSVVADLIERGVIRYGLIVDAEDSREVVTATVKRLAGPDASSDDLRREFAALTLGSGAAAALLARRDLAPSAPAFVGGAALAATEHHELCRGQRDQMLTDSTKLMAAGVALARRTWDLAATALGWSSDAIDRVIMHQVSRVHARSVTQQLGLPLEKAFLTYPEFGNMGPAAVPVTLSKAIEAGQIHPGARVALMGIGSGLNCAMFEVQW
jgi:3-oxoacyl-[acyl-carrier-protein] synthase-3